MAFTAFTPGATVVETADATGFRLYDNSIWTGESSLCTVATVSITYTDEDDNVTTYDDYELIPAGVRTRFVEYLNADGHLISIANLTIASVAAGDVFPDGYYEVTISFDDGTYVTFPYVTVKKGFMAKYYAMKRTMPALLLEWPITNLVREKNYDIYTLGLYLGAAEDAASLAEYTSFRKFIGLIEEIVDHYAIPEPW